ncbi:MAG: hypothetical protein AVDCRST_MAG50-643 [uncultured Acidimicrobiales bacterium]|uniref:FAS1-like dehydratase domain-containing protein n=1 Tax=uncultured Acidimicrobiales bacterium TaxID=310071 RepID=A0A6J4HFY8_9ACTN|nr:MAG: hypothetical protein AVDCRST_MAG50-643 [uncultured Acidimicrobiales bacterium]
MADQGFPIEASHVMMFARSIGDSNPIYYDAEYAATTEPGTIIAPPTFERASSQFREHGLRPDNDPKRQAERREAAAKAAAEAAGESGAAPRGPGGSGLHAEQHYEYHQPMRVGEVLTSTTTPGKRWEKEGRRAGKLVFSDTVTEWRNQQGELVITARGVSVRTERPVES